MGKNGELWDDSALIKAFDEAISKYKIMHGKGGDIGSINEVNIRKGTEENSPIPVDKSNESKSIYMEADDNTAAVLENTTKTGEAVKSSLPETCPPETVEQQGTPNSEQVQDAYNTYTNAQSAEDYNHLLNQYNTIEEQRQKILQQLYQYGNWDYQGYNYDSQAHPVAAPQASCPGPVCSCRAYVCPYSTAPCPSLAVASSCGCDGSSALAHNESSGSVEDGGFIKAARGAIDSAICSFKAEASEEKKSRETETGGGIVAQDKTSQTDLSVVLNAWFSAGFYTGKYLSEQASAKK